MKYGLALFLFLFISAEVFPAVDDSVARQASVLVIPYMPAMHLSDADPDISQGSEMEMPEMRDALRKGLIKALNKNFAEIYDMRGEGNDFVAEANNEADVIYHTVVFETDSVYPVKYPSKFAQRDSTGKKIKDASKVKAETKYINVGVYDPMLIPDLAKKYNADYLIFLNELDIKTHFEDCINLALKIYRRDYKVHYTIFDKTGKQVYGDIAVSHSDSNSNDVNEIMDKNYPVITDYVLSSLRKVVK